MYIFRNLVRLCRRKAVNIGEFFEKCGSNHIYSFIGTLCRKPCRYQKLMRLFINKSAFHIRIALCKPVYNKLCSFLFGHTVLFSDNYNYILYYICPDVKFCRKIFSDTAKTVLLQICRITPKAENIIKLLSKISLKETVRNCVRI